jgi:disulfide bond formation protein DsbB
MTLSEEFLPSLGAGLTLAGEDRSLDELYVTGAAFAEGRLWALSAAYSTLLAIDPATGRVVAAAGLEGLRRPVGLAVRGREFIVLDEDRQVVTFDGWALAGHM